MRFLSTLTVVLSVSLKVLIKHRRYHDSIICIPKKIRNNNDSGDRVEKICVESVELFNFSCAAIEWMNELGLELSCGGPHVCLVNKA